VPGTGAPCGVADYSSHLTASLAGGVRLVSTVPDTASVRLLHVQHAPGLVNDADLVRTVTAAKHAHAPVVVTEHAVYGQASAWERDADVLVALTVEGTTRLRQRWPAKDVRHIPHGCATWFPPRKRKRGKVIGAFGFLGRHKGFWHLLDAIRRIPGSELLLISHAQSAELEERWAAAARDLPVRRISEFLPVEEVARRLAAEADILAYWYDDVPHASASGAVTIGLASGVPVLTSRTGWFEGLAGVTFQPDDLVEGIQRLLDDEPLRERLVDAARTYCNEHNWERTAQRHLALWQSLEAA
jgi:glycosyltransferase involved in cell wall biosynthesis